MAELLIYVLVFATNTLGEAVARFQAIAQMRFFVWWQFPFFFTQDWFQKISCSTVGGFNYSLFDVQTRYWGNVLGHRASTPEQIKC